MTKPGCTACHHSKPSVHFVHFSLCSFCSSLSFFVDLKGTQVVQLSPIFQDFCFYMQGSLCSLVQPVTLSFMRPGQLTPAQSFVTSVQSLHQCVHIVQKVRQKSAIQLLGSKQAPGIIGSIRRMDLHTYLTDWGAADTVCVTSFGCSLNHLVS